MEQERNNNKPLLFFVVIAVLVVGYLHALDHRYTQIRDSKIVYDAWTRKCYAPDAKTGKLTRINELK